MTKFAVFVPLFPPATLGGGPIRTIKALVDSAPPNTRALVFTSDRDLGQSTILGVTSNGWINSEAAAVYYCTPTSIRLYFRGLRSVRNERPDVVYLNSFFNPIFSIFPQLLGFLGFWRGAQLLLAPRGEFGKGALAIRSGKKRLALFAYRAMGLHRRVVWHASSVVEAVDIRAMFGDTARVLIREDETLLPLTARKPSGVRGTGSLRIIFVSRLNPMKGLDLLLRSLALTRTALHLDIYGNAEDMAYVQNCERLMQKLPPTVTCKMHGAIDPKAVRDVFAQGDVFVFPTAGENFGHVIPEALSVSCPVICSDSTPWTDVLSNAGGSVIHGRSPLAWSEAIESFAALSMDQVAERRRLAGAAFKSWMSKDKGDHIFTQFSNLVANEVRLRACPIQP